MEYLIQKFIEAIENYGYKIEYERQENGVWIVRLQDLPPEIDVNLLNCKYTTLHDSNKKNVLDKTTFPICIPNKSEYDSKRYLSVVLDSETYATKINLIDSIIKDYRRKTTTSSYID